MLLVELGLDALLELRRVEEPAPRGARASPLSAVVARARGGGGGGGGVRRRAACVWVERGGEELRS
jgi:hypothetical protein